MLKNKCFNIHKANLNFHLEVVWIFKYLKGKSVIFFKTYDITSESIVPLKKSRFCTNAITLMQEDPTEKELDQMYEIKRRAPKNTI